MHPCALSTEGITRYAQPSSERAVSNSSRLRPHHAVLWSNNLLSEALASRCKAEIRRAVPTSTGRGMAARWKVQSHTYLVPHQSLIVPTPADTV